MEEKKSKIITVRISVESLNKIEQIGLRYKRKKNWLIQTAIDEMINRIENPKQQ